MNAKLKRNKRYKMMLLSHKKNGRWKGSMTFNQKLERKWAVKVNINNQKKKLSNNHERWLKQNRWNWGCSKKERTPKLATKELMDQCQWRTINQATWSRWRMLCNNVIKKTSRFKDTPYHQNLFVSPLNLQENQSLALLMPTMNSHSQSLNKILINN